MVQEPKYTPIKQNNQSELRHYQSYTLVESRDSDLRGYDGFQLALILFKVKMIVTKKYL